MAKSNPNFNPFSHSGKGATGGTGKVNPSGPTVGTEAWGLGKNEADKTENPKRTEKEFPTLAAPLRESAERGAPDKQNIVTFKCSEIHPNCNWQVTGQSENELRPQIEQHAREHHDLREMGEDLWTRVKRTMRWAA
jgi:predicted small metal-binding protein